VADGKVLSILMLHNGIMVRQIDMLRRVSNNWMCRP
jgi:hypothetical protein